MAGRKPIVSARQLKARVQIIMRATDKDVAQNSEQNRLIDMTESMREAGLLQEFLLDCLRSKLRQDEGQTAAAYRMFEGGVQHLPQRPLESQIHKHQQAPISSFPDVQAPTEPVSENEAVGGTPVLQEQDSIAAPALPRTPELLVEARTGGNENSPSTIIENVVRGIESPSANSATAFTPPPQGERRKPTGNLLGAMG